VLLQLGEFLFVLTHGKMNCGCVFELLIDSNSLVIM